MCRAQMSGSSATQSHAARTRHARGTHAARTRQRLDKLPAPPERATMTQSVPRSLRHEYAIHVDREVEAYKNAVSHAHLLRIADAARDALEGEIQIGMRDLLLAAEVDRIIAKRLDIPSFATWRRRLLKHSGEPKRPEHWGLRPNTPLTLALNSVSPESQVVVSGARVESSTLYLAVNGCHVTAVEPEAEVMQRLLTAASAAGVRAKVRGLATELSDFRPDGPLAAMIYTPAAFTWLAEFERDMVIDLLQTATEPGGVHMVESIVAGQDALTGDELRARYSGWDVSFVREPGAARTFVAKKHASSNVLAFGGQLSQPDATRAPPTPVRLSHTVHMARTSPALRHTASPSYSRSPT